MFLFNHDVFYLVSRSITWLYPCVSASRILLKDGVCNYICFFSLQKSISLCPLLFLTPNPYFPTASPSCPSPTAGQGWDAATTKNKELKLNLYGQNVWKFCLRMTLRYRKEIWVREKRVNCGKVARRADEIQWQCAFLETMAFNVCKQNVRSIEVSGTSEESALTETKCCMWPYDVLTRSLFGIGYNAQVWTLLRMWNTYVEVKFYVTNIKSSG